MTFINPINVNSQGIGNSYGYETKTKAEEKEAKKAETAPAGAEQKQVSADAVLNFMAQSAVSVAPTTTKTIDPSKYVDDASAARIAGFISSFEDKVAEGLAAFDKEFPGMSDSSKMTAVLAGLNKEA